jgi:hypothetical protein
VAVASQIPANLGAGQVNKQVLELESALEASGEASTVRRQQWQVVALRARPRGVWAPFYRQALRTGAAVLRREAIEGEQGARSWQARETSPSGAGLGCGDADMRHVALRALPERDRPREGRVMVASQASGDTGQWGTRTLRRWGCHVAARAGARRGTSRHGRFKICLHRVDRRLLKILQPNSKIFEY